MRRCSILFICTVLFFTFQTFAFDGKTFSSQALGSPLTPADTGFGNEVLVITNYNSDLVVGGKFFSAGGVVTARIGGWDGTNWYGMPGLPLGPEVYELMPHDSGILVGAFGPTLHMWNGSAWSTFGNSLGTTGSVFAMEKFNVKVIIGGSFRFGSADWLAEWNDSTGTWDSLGLGVFGGGSNVYDMTIYNGDLIVAGSFSSAGGTSVGSIARWDGSNWYPLGSGLTSAATVTAVFAVTVYAGELIATGTFTSAGGNSATRIARWNGTIWQSMAQGLNGVSATGRALTVYGDSLVVGGTFSTAGSVQADNIAFWNSSWTWAPFGNGLDNHVYSLGVYDSELVAGGSFSNAGGYVAKWSGSDWVPLKEIVTSVDPDKHESLPTEIRLDQNYPNPFNPTTSIRYSINKKSAVHLEILNLLGQSIRTLVDVEQSAGDYEISWDGRNTSGTKVASGLYFYRLSTDEFQQSKKMLLLK